MLRDQSDQGVSSSIGVYHFVSISAYRN